MNSKKIAAIIFLLLGASLLCTSKYISTQVSEGKQKVSGAQRQVDQGNALFSLNPVTEEVGKGILDSVQNEINAGKREIGYYQRLASQLKIGGIIGLVIGIVLLFLCRQKK